MAGPSIVKEEDDDDDEYYDAVEELPISRSTTSLATDLPSPAERSSLLMSEVVERVEHTRIPDPLLLSSQEQTTHTPNEALLDNSARPSTPQSPPLPLQFEAPRSALTWGRNIGSISMLQPQNMINAPAGNNATITNIFNVNRFPSDLNPTYDSEDLHDHDDIATIPRADHEIYASQLLIKKRGYPLWVPGPGRQLPIEYRREGITIGDVGIINPLGDFDFLFNVFQSANGPINRGLIPQNFSPLPGHEFEGEIQDHTVYGPGTYLASSSVRKISTSLDQQFESTAKEAAILTMPDGATTRNLLNTRRVRLYISSNAEDWYKYARITRGREVGNGEIRLVVGVDKVSSWGIATSACRTGQTASYVFKRDPTHLYTWDCIGGSGRVGPQKREITDLIRDNTRPENQTIFIRTINFTLSGKMWNDFPSNDIGQSDSSERPGNPDGSSGPGSHGPPSGVSGPSNTEGRGFGSPGSGSTFAASCHQIGTTQASLSNIPRVKFDPVERGAIHPSALMHSRLHKMFPDADLVITEDLDWISVLRDDDGVFPKPEDLCERILRTHEVWNNSGIIQLLTKDTMAIASPHNDEGFIPANLTSAALPAVQEMVQQEHAIPTPTDAGLTAFVSSSATSHITDILKKAGIGPVRASDAEKGEVIGTTLEGHGGPVMSSVFWPDGKKLAPYDDTGLVWDAEKGETTGYSRPMFPDIEQVHIRTKVINNRDDDIFKNVAFHSLPRSCDAAFSATTSLDARRPCTRGTRIDIITQILAWAAEKDPTKAPPLYLLTGLAGQGKTTIAYTICEMLNEAHLPFASFFCSRQLDSWNSKLLVTTLCHDLAELDKFYAVNLLQVLGTNPKVINARLAIQVDELLVKPWQASISQRIVLPTPVVVVDGLNESDRGPEFLRELLRVISGGRLVGIKFLVTSGPDPNIIKICKCFPLNSVCKLHQVETASQKDIEKYLREALPELKDEPELTSLSEQAGGFFIYATTAVKLISPPHYNSTVSEMRSKLQAMLDFEPLMSHADGDESLLVDDLYLRILRDALWGIRPDVTHSRILYTIVCAESGINISVLADLTETESNVVEKFVESLYAVLFVSPKDGNVYWYHASFRDFVLSRSPTVLSRARARVSSIRHNNNPKYHVTSDLDVSCQASAHHGFLARRCFFLMQSLHFNMCDLPSSFIFDAEVPGLCASINRIFSPTLRYVSRHWARHLLRAVPATDDDDHLCRDLKNFLCNKLLFWIEAMNLIGAKSDISSLLMDAASWLERGKESHDLLVQLTDATNFSTFFAGSPASKSTAHLYISALSMWDRHSPTGKHWRHRFGFIPSVLVQRGTVAVSLLSTRSDPVRCITFSPDGKRIVSGSSSAQVWNAEQSRDLQRHTDFVNSAAFSPDGNQIVSGSWDKSVRVWDTKAGKQLKELLGHTKGVLSVAFSPDGNRIVSGSWDVSIRVWDAKTGKQLTELPGHTSCVYSVAFSPDGNQIVSGSTDKSVRLWDAKTGEQLRELLGHTEGVLSVAFLPDGNQVVSGSTDKSVRLWDAKTGGQLRELLGHTKGVLSVAFSPDGNQIVSGSWDISVRVWDAKTGKQLNELLGLASCVHSVAFSPDGNQIVSGSIDKSVRVWDAKTGEQLRELVGHTEGVLSVGFSSDGNQIVSGSIDKSIRVWHAGEQFRDLRGHSTNLGSVAGNKRIEDTSVYFDPSWVVMEDGWIVSGAERLAWAPPTISNILLRPHNTGVISPNGFATISFAQCKFGTQWHECYTP